MGFQRPSRTVVLATAAVSIVLAAGGFLLGKQSDSSGPSSSVSVQQLKPTSGGDPIDIPLAAKIPDR